MLEQPTIHTHDEPGGDSSYLEFSFFDGVMIECGEISSPEWRPWDTHMNLHNMKTKPRIETDVGRAEVELHSSRHSSELYDSTSQGAEYETCSYMPLKWCVTGGCQSRLMEKPKASKKSGKSHEIASNHVGRPNSGCSSSTSSLSTSASLLDSRSLTTTPEKKVHFKGDENVVAPTLKEESVSSATQSDQMASLTASHGVLAVNRNQGKVFSLGSKQDLVSSPKAESSKTGFSVYRQSDSCRSALAAWASVMGAEERRAGSPRCSSMSMTDLVEATSPNKGPRPFVTWEGSPTQASHLEFTGAVLAKCRIHNDVSAERHSALPVSPVRSSSFPVSHAPFKRNPSGLKPDSRNLSIMDQVPDGTVRGLLHCTLREGLPNYTFLLDDYEEVVTAKIWMEDMMLGEEQGSWRYTFYSLRGEGKKKGKTGWKHWRRKEKLASILVGKMKVSSVLRCNNGKNLSVESEFILSSARSQEALGIPLRACATPQSSLSTPEPFLQSKGGHVVGNVSSSTSHSVTSSSDGHSHVSSPGEISAWYVSQSLLPSSLAEPKVAQQAKNKSKKWSLQSGISGIPGFRKVKKKSNPLSSSPCADVVGDLSTAMLTCRQSQNSSELAAMIINVPLHVQDKRTQTGFTPRSDRFKADKNHLGLISPEVWNETKQEYEHVIEHRPCNGSQCSHYDEDSEQHEQASIMVILPLGSHGRPTSDSNGPSPLIKRWKDGGKCDCKGWDLGCGLMVLKNEKTEGRENDLLKFQEKESQGKPLTLYKQDADQNIAFVSLAPQENGLIALDFRAPLSPLQAFAIAVGILHGRVSSISDMSTCDIAPGVFGHGMEHASLSHQNIVAEQHRFNREAMEDRRFAGSVRHPSQLNPATPLPPASPRGALVKCYENEGLQLHSGHLKRQGSDVLSCASELALSFERV